MQAMTIQQAAEATGWSQRMLRYLEQAGLVAALRTPGGHRHYGAAPDRAAAGAARADRRARPRRSADIAFELRMRTDPALARAVDEWFGAAAPRGRTPGAGIYRRLATDEAIPTRQRASPASPLPRQPAPTERREP